MKAGVIMDKYEEIWNGISDKIFTGTPEEMQKEYIDLPLTFIDEKMEDVCGRNGICRFRTRFKYPYLDLRCIRFMFRQVKEGNKTAIRLANAFLNSSDANLRARTAHNGYGFEKLLHDRDSGIRMAVAKAGYRLDLLVNDGSGDVREVVAWEGYGLDVLVNDESEYVRKTAKRKLQYLKEVKK